MKRLNPLTLDQDGCAVLSFDEIRQDEFQEAQEAAFANLKPGENASNVLARGIAWGVYAQDRFTWLDRNTYQLPKELNPEEGGRVRRFPLMDKTFLELEDFQAAMRQCFEAWCFEETSFERAYEVQCSFIRYEPTIAQPAFPSPVMPHQDLIDGAIIVFNKTGDISGGLSRMYTLAGEPFVELDLGVGEALLVKDDRILHQVTTIQLEPSPTWRPGQRAYRDIGIVRFQALGR